MRIKNNPCTLYRQHW
jgi:hypothetical protein